MTCQKTGYGEFCDEHDFWMCPLKVGHLRKFKNARRLPRTKKVRGWFAKALCRFHGQPEEFIRELEKNLPVATCSKNKSA